MTCVSLLPLLLQVSPTPFFLGNAMQLFLQDSTGQATCNLTMGKQCTPNPDSTCTAVSRYLNAPSNLPESSMDCRPFLSSAVAVGFQSLQDNVSVCIKSLQRLPSTVVSPGGLGWSSQCISQGIACECNCSRTSLHLHCMHLVEARVSRAVAKKSCMPLLPACMQSQKQTNNHLVIDNCMYLSCILDALFCLSSLERSAQTVPSVACASLQAYDTSLPALACFQAAFICHLFFSNVHACTPWQRMQQQSAMLIPS